MLEMSVVSSIVEGEKPSRIRELIKDAYSYQRSRRLARMLIRPVKNNKLNNKITGNLNKFFM